MKAKQVMPQTLESFIKILPKEIQNYLEKSKQVPQTLKWHPEKWVYKHIEIVFDRARKTGDIDLVLTAIFHDLGKMDTTTSDPEKPDVHPSHGHERISTKLVLKHADWIEEMGGNLEKIHFLVANHMRMKTIDEMRPFKQELLRSSEYFNDLKKFTKIDTK